MVLAPGQKHSVVNYDKLTYAGNLANLDSVAKNPNYRFVKGDICDAHAAEAAMSGCDAVVHFAAESHVDRSIYEPAAAIQTNVTGTFVLLQTAKKLTCWYVPTFAPTVFPEWSPALPIIMDLINFRKSSCHC
jgi:dTDP-glucose 4,6-dehydratase